MKKIYEIDGLDIQSLDDFYEVVSTILIPGANWGRNLDAFNDILRGGFGTPDEGFILRWKNSAVSRERLGYPETLNWLHKKLRRCHPVNRPIVRQEIADAENNEGQTIFDILVEIIQTHGPGGEESMDGVDLELS